jgi:hypothetical protein
LTHGEAPSSLRGVKMKGLYHIDIDCVEAQARIKALEIRVL